MEKKKSEPTTDIAASCRRENRSSLPLQQLYAVFELGLTPNNARVNFYQSLALNKILVGISRLWQATSSVQISP